MPRLDILSIEEFESWDNNDWMAFNSYLTRIFDGLDDFNFWSEELRNTDLSKWDNKAKALLKANINRWSDLNIVIDMFPNLSSLKKIKPIKPVWVINKNNKYNMKAFEDMGIVI